MLKKSWFLYGLAVLSERMYSSMHWKKGKTGFTAMMDKLLAPETDAAAGAAFSLCHINQFFLSLRNVLVAPLASVPILVSVPYWIKC